MPYFENLREHIPSNPDNTRVVLFASSPFGLLRLGACPRLVLRYASRQQFNFSTAIPLRPIAALDLTKSAVAWRTGLAACLRRLGQIETRLPTCP
jgi:hypothetical protein